MAVPKFSGCKAGEVFDAESKRCLDEKTVKLRKEIKRDVAAGWKYYTFGTRLKADKPGESVSATRHLTDKEYDGVKDLLAGVDTPREDWSYVPPMRYRKLGTDEDPPENDKGAIYGEEEMPRQLPIYKIKGKFYFLDKRLGEYRNIKNPHDRIDFDSFPKLEKPSPGDSEKVWGSSEPKYLKNPCIVCGEEQIGLHYHEARQR